MGVYSGLVPRDEPGFVQKIGKQTRLEPCSLYIDVPPVQPEALVGGHDRGEVEQRNPPPGRDFHDYFVPLTLGSLIVRGGCVVAALP